MENLRSVLVDLQALAHAAWETLDKLPFLSPRSEGQELESRLNYGRLQALVTATATSAKEVLLVCSEMVERSYEPPATDEDDEGSGGAGTPSGFSNGEPGGSGPGNEPQAQAVTDADPDVSDPGDEPQGRQDLVEVGFDDIDDRAQRATRLPRQPRAAGAAEQGGHHVGHGDHAAGPDPARPR